MGDIHIGEAKEKILQAGFLDVDVDPTLDLFGEIERLKKKKCDCPGALLPGARYSGCGGLYWG